MKTTVLVLSFMFAAGSAYACGDKKAKNSDKVKTTAQVDVEAVKTSSVKTAPK